MKIKKMAP
ncbi:hypothetical protein VTP21DRAFT_2267 [Calcarisporiella thermophila]